MSLGLFRVLVSEGGWNLGFHMEGSIISFLEIEIRLEQRVRQLCQYGHLFLGVVTRHRVRFNEFSVGKFFEDSRQ